MYGPTSPLPLMSSWHSAQFITGTTLPLQSWNVFNLN